MAQMHHLENRGNDFKLTGKFFSEIAVLIEKGSQLFSGGKFCAIAVRRIGAFDHCVDKCMQLL
jgi:hypothetical protein